ncbi:MAG TPA: acyl-CoA dehydrogenase family protein [Jatrophihabitantaceae bacterium]|nr:acyl-CoA dehydrogenase family protein [Jatrophihabitantaceae bacterium]
MNAALSTAFTDEQRSLRDAVRSLLAKRSTSADVRRAMDSQLGYDAQLWSTMCEQIGVAALALPEKSGGIGAGPVENAIVLDELGRALTPSPMLGSAVFGGQLLLALDDDTAPEELLPRIASGEIVTVAWAGADGQWTEPAVRVEAGGLVGTAHYVLDADLAAIVLVVARDEDGVGVYEVAADDAVRTHTPSMDPTRRLGTVTLDGVTGRRLGSGSAEDALRRAKDAAVAALAAEQAGAAQRILELTVEYAKVRVQFGRPIGSFQALKHRMADLHVLVEAARSAAYAAVRGETDASVAKTYCSEAFATVAGEAIQLHGGIAITWEHDAHLYFKRAHGSAQLFGQPREYIDRMAALAGIEDR